MGQTPGQHSGVLSIPPKAPANTCTRCGAVPHHSAAPFPNQTSSSGEASRIWQSEEVQGKAPRWDCTAMGKLRQGAGEDVQNPLHYIWGVRIRPQRGHELRS